MGGPEPAARLTVWKAGATPEGRRIQGCDTPSFSTDIGCARGAGPLLVDTSDLETSWIAGVVEVKSFPTS
jgi:hypothetical protein